MSIMPYVKGAACTSLGYCIGNATLSTPILGATAATIGTAVWEIFEAVLADAQYVNGKPLQYAVSSDDDFAQELRGRCINAKNIAITGAVTIIFWTCVSQMSH